MISICPETFNCTWNAVNMIMLRVMHAVHRSDCVETMTTMITASDMQQLYMNIAICQILLC